MSPILGGQVRKDGVLLAKMERCSKSEYVPAVFDLFSGCGGMSLGFLRSGFRSIGGVEKDLDAAKTFARNLHPESQSVHAVSRDICTDSPAAVLKDLGFPDCGSAVDVLVGGPPCQAFTRVGRAKLNSLAGKKDAHLSDGRTVLFENYLSWVRALKPLAVVMENVPDFLNWGDRNLAEEVANGLIDMGYRPRYTILNASNYGVPQLRERFLLVAAHEALGGAVQFPSPTHEVDLPRGYLSARNVAKKWISSGARGLHYVEAPKADVLASRSVTVAEALADLPAIPGAETKGLSTAAMEYRDGVSNSYTQLMKEGWPPLSESAGVSNHRTRRLKVRDHRIFRAMKPGDEYPVARSIAEALFNLELQNLSRQPRKGSKVWLEMRRSFVPPYDPGKFPNKWCKMDASKPARTLMAHLGKDGYSHIHPTEARVLSVREAARLQSFPDAFKFDKYLNAAYRQIGNAVPPLLAAALADRVRQLLAPGRRGERDFGS